MSVTSIVAPASRSLETQSGLDQYAVAQPFIEAVDMLDASIPPQHRHAIVLLACGVSYRIAACEVGASLGSIQAWSGEYRHEIAKLEPVIKTIAVKLIGGLVSDVVMIGFTAVPELHARAKAGKIDGRELLCLVNAGNALYDLAQRIETSKQPRRDPRVTASRDEALQALKSIGKT